MYSINECELGTFRIVICNFWSICVNSICIPLMGFLSDLFRHHILNLSTVGCVTIIEQIENSVSKSNFISDACMVIDTEKHIDSRHISMRNHCLNKNKYQLHL